MNWSTPRRLGDLFVNPMPQPPGRPTRPAPQGSMIKKYGKPQRGADPLPLPGSAAPPPREPRRPGAVALPCDETEPPAPPEMALPGGVAPPGASRRGLVEAPQERHFLQSKRAFLACFPTSLRAGGVRFGFLSSFCVRS